MMSLKTVRLKNEEQVNKDNPLHGLMYMSTLTKLFVGEKKLF